MTLRLKKFQGNLRKLCGKLVKPIQYELPIGDVRLPLNPLLGQNLRLSFLNVINCVNCGRKTNKSFSQGYCYPCMMRLAECDFCMIHPEKCHYAEGTCRDEDWAHSYCMQDHTVYLANSSGIKVGITRHIPNRWIDQGAVQGLPIYTTKNRLHSGLVEVAFKEFVNDKTNWRKMLTNDLTLCNLPEKRDELFSLVKDRIDQIQEQIPDERIQVLTDSKVVELEYPVLQYPEKVSSLNFDKTPLIEGKLMGIKGQYLILDTGVLNIRKFSGYKVEVTHD